MTEEQPKFLSPEEIADVKNILREHVLSEYVPQDGVRRPITPEQAKGEYHREFLESQLAALESEDVDALEKLAHSLDVWYVYILDKNRAEGLKTKELREKLLAWINTILSR